jgi:hypothetical protein
MAMGGREVESGCAGMNGTIGQGAGKKYIKGSEGCRFLPLLFFVFVFFYVR